MLPLIGIVGVAPALSGCSYLKSRQAKQAYMEYQQALAAGDMNRAQIALTKLVRVDEDVADFWMQLGKVDLQLGNYRGAYDALLHAHELDQTNVEVISTLAQLAVYSGEIDLANEQAKNLALLAPEHPTVTLVEGFVALQQGNLEKAEQDADKLIAAAPKDSIAKILKAKVLVNRGQVDAAVTLMEDQHRLVPRDRAAMRALSAIYRSRLDWPNAARVETDLYRLDSRDTRPARLLIESSLRAGNIGLARKVSGPLLSPKAPLPQVIGTLDLWARFGPKNAVIPDAASLASAMTDDGKAAFADYFNRVGKPALAGQLLNAPQLPVKRSNSKWNAVLAQSMALQGRRDEARTLFDKVLSVEPDQMNALRGRSELLAKTGNTRQAIIDAQRLVTANPTDGGDRLLLAQAYFAAGKRQEVRRTLWEAFQDMPEDERVFSALKSVLASSGDVDAERRLTQELLDRRSHKMTKELV